MQIKRNEMVEVTYEFKFYAEWNKITKEFEFYAEDCKTSKFYELGMNEKGTVIINLGRGVKTPPIAKQSWHMSDKPIFHLLWLQKNVENKSYGRDPIPASNLSDITVEIWK